MINLVVQVCDRLARRVGDEYYETETTMRVENKGEAAIN